MCSVPEHLVCAQPSWRSAENGPLGRREGDLAGSRRCDNPTVSLQSICQSSFHRRCERRGSNPHEFPQTVAQTSLGRSDNLSEKRLRQRSASAIPPRSHRCDHIYVVSFLSIRFVGDNCVRQLFFRFSISDYREILFENLRLA